MCSSYAHECRIPEIWAQSIISPESWGFSSIPQLADVGMVFAYASNYRAKLVWSSVLHGYYTGTHSCNSRANSCSFQHWHTCCTPAKLVPTLAATTSHHKMQHKQNSCQLWALPVSDQSWHRCCNARIVPEFDTGGRGLTRVNNCSSYPRTKRWKLGIITRVLTTVSHWLASWLPQLLQQWKNSLTFV